jgi:UDP-2-acetamido-2-deoxy-ribo-hexuluronate aminotransferase
MKFLDLQTQHTLIRNEIIGRFNDLFHSGQYILGPEVEELENSLARYVGSSFALTVSSGTDALLMSLMALGVKPGDEIITTAFTFVSTVEVILRLGATPVFVDVNLETACIDEKLIEDKLTSRTKAIIAVSLYGHTAELNAINRLAQQHGINVIEDAAQSFGARYGGRLSCNITQIGCTSFFPSKPLGCYGDGGAIFTNDENLFHKLKMIRSHGSERKYHHELLGIGGRMDTLQCAVVLAKLKIFDEELIARRKIAEKYYKEIRSPSIKFIKAGDDTISAHGLFTLRSNKREKILIKLNDADIPASIHYPNGLHRQPFLNKKYLNDKLPNTDLLSSEVFSIPLHPYLTKSETEKIISTLNKF